MSRAVGATWRLPFVEVEQLLYPFPFPVHIFPACYGASSMTYAPFVLGLLLAVGGSTSKVASECLLAATLAATDSVPAIAFELFLQY